MENQLLIGGDDSSRLSVTVRRLRRGSRRDYAITAWVLHV